jgi:hypothetical protein
MGFSYTQIGQENSFGMFDIVNSTEMRIEEAKKLPDVEFLTVGATGRAIRERYGNKTPVSVNAALDNWDSKDVQSVYYNCENYVANLFRCEDKIFIRALYLFDEMAEDYYLERTCKTFDGIYENQPVVDTVRDKDGVDTGWYIDCPASAFDIERVSDTELAVFWDTCRVTFGESEITIEGAGLSFDASRHLAKMNLSDSSLDFIYRDRPYSVKIEGGAISTEGDILRITPTSKAIKLIFNL